MTEEGSSGPGLPGQPAAPIEPAPPHEPAQPLEPAAPLAPPPALTPPALVLPRLETTRGLIGASFDLLGRATDEMRRASFYVGIITLGTVAPFALATWALEVRSIHLTVDEVETLYNGAPYVWYNLLAWPAVLGLLVATVESRVMAASMLGGRMAGRPLTVREALARSRMVFWRAIAVAIVVGIPVSIAQVVIDALVEAVAPIGADGALIATVMGAALVGAPFAYVLSGVVLGDVGVWEATRRSFRVYGARRVAAVVVALFEVAAFLLILLGLGAGLDIAFRVFSALGLGADSGPAGLMLVTAGIAAVTFAFGTLLYTVTAISLAPQVVMFVGLTHATMGLDHVRPGADRDPMDPRPAHRRFRVLTRPMLLGVVVAWLGLFLTVAQIFD